MAEERPSPEATGGIPADWDRLDQPQPRTEDDAAGDVPPATVNTVNTVPRVANNDADDADDGPLSAPVPEALNRNLRCCIACRLIKTLEQFYQQGCENCTFLNLEGDRERIEDCTTTEFQGMLGVVDPGGSWAARYAFMQRERVPGVYSLSVDHSNLRREIRELFEDNGIKL